MNHVQKTDAELASEVEEHAAELMKAQEEEESPETKEDPRDKEVYSFPFSFTDQRGRTYSGTFTNHVLSIGEKMNVSVLESTFNAGQPYNSIEPIQQVVNRGIAHMTISLKKRENQKPKGWADNLRALRDEDLVLALFGEVSAHEGTFHGRTKAPKAGQGEEGDA